MENSDDIKLYRSRKKLSKYLLLAFLVFLGSLAYVALGLARSLEETVFFGTFVVMTGVFNILLAKLLIVKTPLVTVSKEDIAIGKKTVLKWQDIENITAGRKKNFMIVFHVSDPSKYPLTKQQAEAANKGRPVFKFNLTTLSDEDFEELESLAGKKILEKYSARKAQQPRIEQNQTTPPAPNIPPPPPFNAG